MAQNRNRWYTGAPWKPDTDISRHQTEFATALRIPFLTTPYPRKGYKFGIVVDTDKNADWRGEIPTNEEVEVIASIRTAYFENMFPEPNPYRAEMEAYAPYDVENGYPAYYFIKYANYSWAYRRNQWQGPTFVPGLYQTSATLEEVVERADRSYGILFQSSGI